MPARKPNRICTACGKRGAKYLGRFEHDGHSEFLGFFCTKRERTAAREAARLRHFGPRKPQTFTVASGPAATWTSTAGGTSGRR